MGFSRQEYWSGLPFPPPEDLPDPGIEPTSPALQADSLPLSHWGSPIPIGYIFLSKYLSSESPSKAKISSCPSASRSCHHQYSVSYWTIIYEIWLKAHNRNITLTFPSIKIVGKRINPQADRTLLSVEPLCVQTGNTPSSWSSGEQTVAGALSVPTPLPCCDFCAISALGRCILCCPLFTVGTG